MAEPEPRRFALTYKELVTKIYRAKYEPRQEEMKALLEAHSIVTSAYAEGLVVGVALGSSVFLQFSGKTIAKAPVSFFVSCFCGALAMAECHTWMSRNQWMARLLALPPTSPVRGELLIMLAKRQPNHLALKTAKQELGSAALDFQLSWPTLPRREHLLEGSEAAHASWGERETPAEVQQRQGGEESKATQGAPLRDSKAASETASAAAQQGGAAAATAAQAQPCCDGLEDPLGLVLGPKGWLSLEDPETQDAKLCRKKLSQMTREEKRQHLRRQYIRWAQGAS